MSKQTSCLLMRPPILCQLQRNGLTLTLKGSKNCPNIAYNIMLNFCSSPENNDNNDYNDSNYNENNDTITTTITNTTTTNNNDNTCDDYDYRCIMNIIMIIIII